MRLHPDGYDLKPFPPLQPGKVYDVWEYSCGDDYCECRYVYIMEADHFESYERGIRALGGREVWAGTWTSYGEDYQVLDRERACAENYIKVRKQRMTT